MKTLAEHFGAEWQNDVKPGGRKLSQFRAAFKIQKTPPCHSQEKEADPTVFVKLFDPCSNWTWFCTEWDEDDNEAFGLVRGHEEEFGYVRPHRTLRSEGPLRYRYRTRHALRAAAVERGTRTN